VKDLGYEEVTPDMKKSVLGFSLPIVQSPIDLPGYDNGQRFDLRLPYAERGYEDPDTDVMVTSPTSLYSFSYWRSHHIIPVPTCTNDCRGNL
jgi:hypothetical protein